MKYLNIYICGITTLCHYSEIILAIYKRNYQEWLPREENWKKEDIIPTVYSLLDLLNFVPCACMAK